MTKLCDTCGIVHFPNEIDSKNQIECIQKLKDVLEETLEVLKEREQNIELLNSVIKVKDLYIFNKDEEIRKKNIEIV